MAKLVDCEKCKSEKSVWFEKDLPNICEDCLPDYMCQSCGGFSLFYEGNKANGTWYRCNDCDHSQQREEVQND